MMKILCISLVAFGALQAQPVVAPTTEQVGSPRGENSGNYNITNSFELGYRWSLVGGDLGEYRSDVNYRNGLRLLSSSLSIDSRDGHGHFFDQILLNTLGLGNDPYQSAILRIQKNGLYRYDMTWRLNDYYNPGLTVAGGLHLMDTVRRVQDHDLTLLPQSHYRFRIGYSRNTQDGPALTTSQEFDANSAGLPVFANIRRQWNEYRLGADVEFAGFRFTVLHRWDYYKEDTPYSAFGVVSAAGLGIANDQTVLQQFTKAAPVHGSNPGWLGNLIANHKRWAMNARISYLMGHNYFGLSEFSSGLDRFGGAANRQIAVLGDAQRPFVAGDFNLSLFPTSRLTIVNNTSVNNLRINGPSSYTEILDGSSSGETLYFRYLGIRTVTNSTDVNYRLKPWIGLYAGYSYADRLVRTTEAFSLPAFANSAESDTYENTNHLHSGVVGVRLRPVKELTASLEGEIGRADNPFTPVSDANYHTLGGRVDYRTRKLQLSTQYRQFYNVNSPVPESAYSAHSRNYTATASWSARNWFSLDASYVKLHLDSIGGIAFFAGLPRQIRQTGYSSVYVSNVHGGNLAAHFVIGRRADVFIGYNITKDTGDGRATQTAGIDPVANPVAAMLASVQTFPLTYQSPMGRVSIRISNKMRWNAGYQFYTYNETFQVFGAYQNFHANTGYTSVLWTF
ncbi:MAG TPA: hypothetical protein VMS37_32330 [Verrucomicrobiae bacterium]|nr:hypothetical protein [Verrucomicrobiae bacterium]